MDLIVKGLGIVTAIISFIIGIVQGDLILWWTSGLVSGILIFAFGTVIEHLQNISYD